jgi:hypothetical protein
VTAEALRRWASRQRPRFEKAKVIDGSASGQALYRWLGRNNVTSGLHAPDSPMGQQLIRSAGRHLPAVCGRAL